MKVDFTNVPEMVAYIPQIKVFDFDFPLLACDIDGVDKSLVGWKDPKHSYDKHNLIFDVDSCSKRKRECNEEGLESLTLDSSSGDVSYNANPIFSIVKHWPMIYTNETQDTAG